jgi:hypothetical protein
MRAGPFLCALHALLQRRAALPTQRVCTLCTQAIGNETVSSLAPLVIDYLQASPSTIALALALAFALTLSVGLALA